MLATEAVKLLSNSVTEAVLRLSMWRWWTRKRQGKKTKKKKEQRKDNNNKKN
jgi:hypothetical protein